MEDFVASEYEGSIEGMFLVEGLLSFLVLCMSVGVWSKDDSFAVAQERTAEFKDSAASSVFFCVPVVFNHCASYTDYRPIFRKIVLWQAQHHSYAVGHFKHCSSYGFFLPSSTFLISDRKCRVFPRCSFQYDRTYMPGCQAMLFGFSQSVEVEGPFKSGHHLC